MGTDTDTGTATRLAKRSRSTDPMVRAIVAIIVSLAAAAFVASDAVGRSMQRRAPQLVAKLPTADGSSRSNLASFILAGGLQKSVLDKINLPPVKLAEIDRLSRSAYAMEPLDGAAVRNLGLLANNAGQDARALALMTVADRLSKRDLAVNSLLALRYAQTGDLDRSLGKYDQALRTSTQAREMVIPAMIQQMKSTEMVAPVIRLLARRPPWADHFWAAAPRYSEAHPALGAVRLALADRGIAIKPAADRELVAAFASSGNIGLAQRLMRRVSESAPQAYGVVRNGGFDRNPDFMPFDWAPQFDGSMATDLDPQAGVLRISVFGEGSGPAARQMVVLPAAAYRLEVSARDWTTAQADKVYFKLRCADPKVFAETDPVRLSAAKLSERIARPSADCTANWLTIYAAPSNGAGDSSVSLDRVALVPIGG
jgi:hypothetical protein